MKYDINGTINIDKVNKISLYNDLNQLSENFFGKNKVSMMGVARLYFNDSSFSMSLANQKAAELQLVKHKRPIALAYVEKSQIQPYYFFSNHNEASVLGLGEECIKDVWQLFDANHYILVTKVSDDFVDMCQLSLKSNTPDYNQYIKNIDTFKLFFYFLYDKGNDFVKNFTDTKISFDKKNIFTPIIEKEIENVGSINKYLLLNEGKEIYLNKKEFQILKEIAKGHSSKAIGEKMFLSYRTVEKYIENIKIKSSLNYKDSLVKLYYNNI